MELQEAPSAEASAATGDDTILARELLYDLVWSEPMLKVSARFGVSSSYMARVCALMNVPRPERGYWAKMAFGKRPSKPRLCEARPGDQLSWVRGKHRRHDFARPSPRPPDKPPRPRRKLDEPRPDLHPLVVGAKAHFEAGSVSYGAGHLKPAKKLLLDLVVSKTGLDKALAFANELFLELEANGHRVVIAPHGEPLSRAAVDEHEIPRKNHNPNYTHLWGPVRCTVVYIGTVAIGLTIIEMSERVEGRYVNGEFVRLSDNPPKRGRSSIDYGWTGTHDFASGRLCLQAYSPYLLAQWTHQWRETKDRDLTSRIASIVNELTAAVGEVSRLYEEGERQAKLEHQRWEEQKRKWEREAAEQRAAKALADSQKELLGIIESWAKAKRLEEFFADAEAQLDGLDSNARQHVLDRLKRARELVGTLNAAERFRRWKAPDERLGLDAGCNDDDLQSLF